MPKLVTWDSFTIEVNGRQVSASWAIEDGVVRVITPFGHLATQVGSLDPKWLAERLARELAWRERAAERKVAREGPQK